MINIYDKFQLFIQLLYLQYLLPLALISHSVKPSCSTSAILEFIHHIYHIFIQS